MQSHQMKRAAGNSTPTDPDFKQTVLLLHGDGTNGGQNNTFIDSSTNNFTITRNGNTTQGTFSPFSQPDGYWSNYFDGTGDYLSIAGSSAFDFGTGNFTIEMWVYFSSYGTSAGFLVGQNFSSSVFQLDTNGKLQFYSQPAAGYVVTGATAVPKNQWNHVALSRDGNTFRVFLNGSLDGSGTDTNAAGFNSSYELRIAAWNTSTATWVGYLSNFRLVKGTAVYTSAFTPPTTPLTAITNTSLLTCQSNRFKDNSSNAFTITRNGNTAVTAFSPFAPTAAYSASINGGSAYFDGTGDYLDIANSNTFDTNSTYTLEAWFYQPSAGNATFFGRGGGAGSWSASDGHQILLFIESGGIYLQFNTSGSAASITTTSPAAGQWNHAAVGYDGTTTRLWLNGASVGSSTAAYTMPTTRNIVRIGAAPSGGNLINGYIGNVRFVKGTDVYGVSNTSITVPTTPLTAITNTALLTNFTNAAILDNTGKNNLETVGNAQISTSVVKYGTGSMYFDGTGDYIVMRNNDNFQFGTGNFTIEFWLYASNASSTHGLIAASLTGSGYWASLISSNTLYWQSINGTTNLVSTSYSSYYNQWVHVAFVRNSGTTYIYLNGVSAASAADTYNYNGPSGNYEIGRDNDNSAYLTGYIDDLRITKGVARYTANFTVPARAFPDK